MCYNLLVIVADSIILDHFNLEILIGLVVSELCPYIFRFFKNLVFLRKIFGCQPIQNDDQTDTKLFSIYQDIKNNPNKWLIFTLLALTYLKSCIIFMIPSCTLISNPVCPSCKLFLGHALTFLSSMSASIASVLSLSTSSVSSIKLPFFLLRSRKS